MIIFINRYVILNISFGPSKEQSYREDSFVYPEYVSVETQEFFFLIPYCYLVNINVFLTFLPSNVVS